MALSALDDKSKMPDDKAVAAVLGPSKSLWDELIDTLAAEFAPVSDSWGFSGKAWGWSLRLKRKKRTILYLTPCTGYLLAGFALGEKAVRAAQESRLPKSVLKVIDEAPRYAEGRGVRLEVRRSSHVKHVTTLAKIKMAN